METHRIEGPARGPVVLVHGGAGDVLDSRRPRHVEGCRAAARAGRDALLAGGSALDAAVAAARLLEDDPVFNAGTGASLDEHGDVVHDAAVMSGRGLRAGAVCALRGFRNPIDVARAALEDGRHVLYAAEGAAAFARAAGIAPLADPSVLVTDAARQALARRLAGSAPAGWAGGTIGAVAVDASGDVAAATSTGGTVAKRAGRVGDSPIVGAGTLADDRAGAISATGDGEGILKVGLAHLVAAALASGASCADASATALATMETRTSARGGLIVVRPDGAWAATWITRTMSWAAAWDGGDDAGS
jgi:beta-aspartyl-peptidase (threonine type)